MLYPLTNDHREARRLDGVWAFQAQQPGDDASAWPSQGLPSPVSLAVPGSWNEQRAELFTFFGPGWYQLDVHVPASWSDRAVWIRVGAAHYKSRVWLNGVLLGSYEGGSLPHDHDASAAAQPGRENRLVILVDGSLDPWQLPPATLFDNEERIGFHNCNPAVTYDFFPFAGLHRSVWLCSGAPNRIYDVTVTASIPPVDHANLAAPATVEVRAVVPDASAVASLVATIEGRDFALEHSTDGAFVGRLVVPRPRRWHVGRPELYAVDLALTNRDGTRDGYRQTFGIRTLRIDEQGLLLNGQRVFLTGYGKHEDADIVGRAFNAPLVVRDFELMRWSGANSFRTAHYPHAEEILDHADREGVLVIAETSFVGMNDRMFTPEVQARALPMIERMIARDKNHPSVFAWSLANEPYIATDAAEAFFKAMADTARRCDPTRPITYVGHAEIADNRAAPYYDFFCLNKYFGWYVAHGKIDHTLPMFERCLDEFHAAFKKPMMVTEFGADAMPGLHAWPAQPFSEEFQAEIVEKQLAVIRRKPWIFGAHVWAFADFRTGMTLSRIIHNRKGVFTRDRQPKLVAHTLRRLWTSSSPRLAPASHESSPATPAAITRV